MNYKLPNFIANCFIFYFEAQYKRMLRLKAPSNWIY